MNLFPSISEKQKEIVTKIMEVEEEAQATAFLEELKRNVIPFKNVTEKTISKLFPKIKKLKIPSLDEMDFKDISYLSWYDIRLDRKLLVVEYNGKLMGMQGTFRESKKGICSLCNRHGEIGLFMSTVKTGTETFISRGNYICKDSQICNENITRLDKLDDFVETLNK